MQNTNLAPRADQTSRDNPWPLALLSENLKKYIDRLTPVWVEAQVVEYNPRPATRMGFFVVRDLNSKVSMTVKAFGNIIADAGPAFEVGSRVVLRVKPDFYEVNGQLSLQASHIHTSGLGDLLAQIEMLRKRLAAEGIFDQERKKPLPFLPHTVGLICGRGAKAEHDVIVNAQVRWPATRFEIREVAVQGEYCVAQVGAALQELDALPQVQVIVIARGGGAVEDLLPFSDEALVRAASAAKTPIVSAIGHETDAPLLDLVADYRASTPTDAARRIVPDVGEETTGLNGARDLLHAKVMKLIEAERSGLAQVRARPVMQRPSAMVEGELNRLHSALDLLRANLRSRLDVSCEQLRGHRSSLRALSPGSTLERGYAIIRTVDAAVVRDSGQVQTDQFLRATLAQGSLEMRVTAVDTDSSTTLETTSEKDR